MSGLASGSRKRWLTGATVLATLTGVLTAMTPSAVAAAPGAPNNDPHFLQVYTNNVENLPTANLRCHGDWQDLVYYLKTQPYRPDIFLVQQISNIGQLRSYLDRLSKEFGEKYAGVISEEHPAAMNSPCGAPKDHQTNAVIYRTGRFSLAKDAEKRWQSQAHNGSGCANNHQARTKNVKAKLYDKIAKKHVTAASLHWPTGAMGGPQCAESNAVEAAAEMRQDGYGGSLLILAGDANVSDRSGASYRPWYSRINGDLGGSLGYRDAIYAGCAAAGGDVKACLGRNATTGSRIDFLFARRGSGGLPHVTDSHTVTFDEGDAADRRFTGNDRADRDYSDHRAIRARVHY